MNYSPRKLLCLLLVLGSILTNLHGQMVGQMILSPDGKTILIAVLPEQTIQAPQNITNTGQITLKAPTGSLIISNFKSITGIWNNSIILRQPSESPNEDYFVFNLSTHLANPSYVANTIVPLFSFENEKGCTNGLQFIHNFSDPFWPPNSANANIGNQLTILQYGIENAYEGNDPILESIRCPNLIKFDAKIDSLECYGGTGYFHFQLLEGDLPFHYQFVGALGNSIADSLFNHGDKLDFPIIAGVYNFFGQTKNDSIHQTFEVIAPTPLRIEIVEQTKVPCHEERGASILLKGSGGKIANNYSFEWSNGKTGNHIDELEVNTYWVTITDLNDCFTSKEIEIEAEILPTIDSVELIMPTCHNETDGAIEMVAISNGVPPFNFGLNQGKFQQEPYFENLASGSYQLIITDSRSCVTEQWVNLDNPPKLEILPLPIDSILFPGESTVLGVQINDAHSLNYKWAPEQFLSCSDCPSPIAQPNITTSFELIISNESGCEVTYSQKIKVLEELPIYIPNVFSPNNDGTNDHFTVLTSNKVAFGKRLQIFNRWGQLVYDQKNLSQSKSLSWDGMVFNQPAPSGVYLFLAEIILENGDLVVKKGDFLLKR